MSLDTRHPEEGDLVNRASMGDSGAFGHLVEYYMRRSYLVALSLVGSHEDALDLSQDAFARAYRARHSLDPEKPFYAWYYQILRRLCFNFLRDRKLRSGKVNAMGPWPKNEVPTPLPMCVSQHLI